MRQIIHTFLLAIRLISSTTFNSALELQFIGNFDRALLNAAFGYVYMDPGVLRKQTESSLELIPVATAII